MGTPQFVYPVTSQWKFELFSVWGYLKKASTNVIIQLKILSIFIILFYLHYWFINNILLLYI